MKVPWYVGVQRLTGARRLLAPRTIRTEINALLKDGFVAVKSSLTIETCDEIVDLFHSLEQRYKIVFDPQRDESNHYPRIVNIHALFPEILLAFTKKYQSSGNL